MFFVFFFSVIWSVIGELLRIIKGLGWKNFGLKLKVVQLCCLRWYLMGFASCSGVILFALSLFCWVFCLLFFFWMWISHPLVLSWKTICCWPSFWHGWIIQIPTVQECTWSWLNIFLSWRLHALFMCHVTLPHVHVTLIISVMVWYVSALNLEILFLW